MAEHVRHAYEPDVASPPGETLQETIDFISMTQRELAGRLGKSAKHVNEVIKGKVALTPDMALALERVLGVPASFWNRSEQLYREHVEREKERHRLAPACFGDWARRFPLKEMARRGWVKLHDDTAMQVRELLDFFGVASPKQLPATMPVAFRKSEAFTTDKAALAAWLRRGVLEAQRIGCRRYDRVRFLEALKATRALTREPASVFQPRMVDRCADAGVALVFIRELPRTRVSGATRWLTSDKALIQLTLRGKRDDLFWFTFFHEAGHIYRHGRKQVFIDREARQDNDNEEVEANRFAQNILIPPDAFRAYLRRFAGCPSLSSVEAFADRIGIAPGIVVGRLQHSGVLHYSQGNNLKKTLEWA